MKKLFLSFIFAAIAAVSFSQVQYTEVAYDSLSIQEQEMFSKYGTTNPYGNLVKAETDSIVAIFKVTGIKKSRRMVADSAGVKSPEVSDQFMTIYTKNGETMAFVSLDDPTVNGNDAATIAALMSGTGLKQGDDEFPEVPENTSKSATANYTISSEW